MAVLLAAPPSKAKPFSVLAPHRPNVKPANTHIPAITHYHQEFVYDARNIRKTQNSLNYGSKRKFGNDKSEIPIASTASIPSPECGKDLKFGRILLSDVVVKRRRNVYWGRKWNSLDVATVGVVVAMHSLCLFVPFTFNWGALWVAVGLYIITGLLGITLSFHRHLSHKSFKLPKWLEYFLHIVAFKHFRLIGMVRFV